MKALQVKLGRRVVGIFVPPRGGTFSAMLANVPQTYMRAFVTAGNGQESRRWQLPDIKEGERLSFRMIDISDDTAGVPAQETQVVPAKERARLKAMAQRGYAHAMRETDGADKQNSRMERTRKKRARG